MKCWKFCFVILYCGVAFGAPSNNSSETNASKTHSAEEVSGPPNMNIADYYYSIFGKHLDYDYKEPLLTFYEPEQNDLSDEIESEVDKNSDFLWNDHHSRKKRFILVPSNFYNSTRRWAQEMRRLRMERRRLRMQRRQQWQLNRINYLNRRSEALRNQANRLSQVQLRRQQQTTRSVPAQQQKDQTKTTTTNVINNNKPTPINSDTNSTVISIDPIVSESKQVPVQQVPLPTKS